MAVEPFNENYTMPREDGHQGWTRILESMVERRKGDGSRWRWKEGEGQMEQERKVRSEVKSEGRPLSSSVPAYHNEPGGGEPTLSHSASLGSSSVSSFCLE